MASYIMHSSRRPTAALSLVLVFGVIFATAAMLVAVELVAPPMMTQLLAPTLAAMTLFVLFYVLLRAKLGGSVFGELGLIYVAWIVVYTVIPGFGFAIRSAAEFGPIALLSPTTKELADHLWRHVIFILAVAVGYLLTRGRKPIPVRLSLLDQNYSSDRMVSVLIALIVACIASLLLLSAPVSNYYEHYVRYEHLSWPVRKFVSLVVRLNFGFYSVLLVLLFLNYERYRRLIPLVLIALCVHEMTYSLGSRILSLLILLQAALLYHLLVREVSLLRVLVAGIIMGTFFTLVEFFREVQFDLNSLQLRLSDEGIKSAGEFSAVFFTGFHLYAERGQGSLPPIEWPMFFSDFISLVTFGDFTRWNPMEWYARNYYPGELVAPMTLSPIADSAVWGGELDLFIRGLLNGAFFAVIVRCFLRWSSRWWSLLVYSFCYATAIVTIKYSIFYILTPLLKTILPTVLAFAVIRRLSRFRLASGAGGDNISEYFAQKTRQTTS